MSLNIDLIFFQSHFCASQKSIKLHLDARFVKLTMFFLHKFKASCYIMFQQKWLINFLSLISNASLKVHVVMSLYFIPNYNLPKALQSIAFCTHLTSKYSSDYLKVCSFLIPSAYTFSVFIFDTLTLFTDQ